MTGGASSSASRLESSTGHPAIPEQIHERALAAPAAPAIEAPDLALTRGELDGWALDVAGDLRALGVGTDSVAGVLMPRSARLAVAALGAMHAGAAYLPLDPDHPADRNALALRDARCPVLLTTPELAPRAPAGSWPTVLLSPAPPAGARGPAPPVTRTAPDNLAYVIYTSGSTGTPKGVQVTHANLANLSRWHAHAFGLTAADRVAHAASPAFDAAVWELWPALAAGASVHVPAEAARRDPERLRDWLVAERITVCFAPTAMAEVAVTLEWPAGAALRLLLTGADTLHRHPPSGLPFRLVNNYGPTECTVVATSGPVPARDVDDQRPSIGGPISNVTVQILDDELRPVPPGATGELCIGGAGVSRGYLGRPGLTAARFVPDPRGCGGRLYRTGDLAALRAGGEIDFRGRSDSQVQVRGFRVEPDEIAAVLMGHPAVLSAAVSAWDPLDHDVRLAAYVVPAPGPAPSPEALRSFLAARLPAHMVPAAFVHLPAMPLTPSGKVDRAALPAPGAAAAPPGPGFAPPRTPVEERVARLVAELLRAGRVGFDENFFLLGGHSLLGAQLITRVREAYGVELTLQGLFDNPTVEAMSAEIERLVVERLESMSDDEVERLLA
ncbi:MAG TPA: amino acid adenylation domain-containing protein [Candidatus Dormibacteraeota bacterium]